MADLALFGVTQFGLGLVLLTLGTRLVSATESALVNTLEVPLAALWVWLAFAELPTWSTLAGGAVVIAAVTAHVLLERVGNGALTVTGDRQPDSERGMRWHIPWWITSGAWRAIMPGPTRVCSAPACF